MTSQDLLAQYLGQVVPYTFHGEFVCLSYAISLLGSTATLELLRRRTSHRGLHNFLLLISAATLMGGIAIWSMHYIGNRAIQMLDGDTSFQIAYSTRLTVLSLFVPILALVIAFIGVSGNGRIRHWRICMAGLLLGSAICGMHYLADASIRNYSSSYEISYVVGAALIAVSASTTAIAIFFVFEATWKNTWWKRLGLRQLHAPGSGVSQKDTLVIVICLSVAAGLTMVGSAMYSCRIRTEYASKSQQVVLAAAVFDNTGRIMVTQEGLLPTEVVTDAFVQETNDSVIDTRHRLFHWMFQASRYWSTVSAVIDLMAEDISTLTPDANTRRRSSVKLIRDNGLLVENYDVILCELFCLAAAALASRIGETLGKAGVLWDDIFATGGSLRPNTDRLTVQHPDMLQLRSLGTGESPPQFESLAEGLFASSHAQEYGKLEATGYRFAEVHQVAGSIRSSMRIESVEFESRLHLMSVQKGRDVELGPGVHLSMFVVRARLDRSGFDVIVRKAARNILPTAPMPIARLQLWHRQLLNRYHGTTVAALTRKLGSMDHESVQETVFASELRRAISHLLQSLGDGCFNEATLLPREVCVPSFAHDNPGRPSTRTLLAFGLVLPVHATVHSTQCEFTPLRFLKLRQHTYDGSPYQAEFSQTLHHDLSRRLRNDIVRRDITAPTARTSMTTSSILRALDRRKKQRTLLDMVDLDTHRPKDQALMNAFISFFELLRFQHLLTRWVACDNIPFHKLESPYFRDLMAYANSVIADSGSIPTHSTIREWIVRSFNRHKGVVAELLCRSLSRINVSFDAWSSRKFMSLLGLTVHG
ncbi:MHYT domain-containingsignaling protein [Purpureocillium lavendulum]|uniref:MHYT domain-containingsignaling protein n=1 Tax=Purpureocillium lavendulum TaxID=1247861 RepID=A0AB34FC05_9HYPO|nr:MHYT domain-containingsignaling protein [Purpureocillium lavendulum]